VKILASVCAALMILGGSAGFASAAAHAPQAGLAPSVYEQASGAQDGFQVADAGDFGAGVAVGVIGSLIAQGVAEERARRYRSEQWRWNRCAREFRSFNPNTGLYTTYGGQKRLCPYLR